MPVSPAQKKATAKYEKNNYDNLRIRVPKNQKDLIQSHATQRGESLNGFVNRAIAETMQRDNQKQ